MKKFLSILVCATLLASIFAGCQKTPTEHPISQPTPQEPLCDETPAVVPKDEPTTPVEESPAPQEPAETLTPSVSEPDRTDPVCTFSIRCDTILKNTALLDGDKLFLVPDDGVIFAATEMSFTEGESVFDLLSRITRENNIHLEFENTPIYNTAYIKGIANLYERDCGEGSGWIYRVNGEIPNHGCSQHSLRAGDVVEWIYSCHHGDDID